MSTQYPLKAALCGAIFCASSVTSSNPAQAANSAFETIDQGPNWTETARAEFYSQNQGSRIMPLPWLKALKQPSGQPFLADSLSRYGYLANPASSNGLPVGFTATGPQGAEFAGMTCSACHTRQIEADGKEYRIDGGPAITDLQSFFADLDAAVGRVLESDTALQTFAAQVLGPSAPQPDDLAALREMLKAWYLRYHALMTRALPEPPWGVGRADAAGMIFNRISGLDIGLPPTHLIPENIEKAYAPVRYPFLWNAPKQDKTQWAGFADNGSDSLALSRNLGEVYGVFGDFAPVKDSLQILGVNYLNNNSADFDGLNKLEFLVKQIGPPKWPKAWPIDVSLAEGGKAVYNRPTAQGGCAECHGITPGKVRPPNIETWATPVQDVGTDSKQYDVLNWTASTGVLEGAQIPGEIPPLQAKDTAFGVLKVSVLGSIIQKYAPLQTAPKEMHAELLKKVPQPLQDLKGAVLSHEDLKSLGEGGGKAAPAAGKYKYEARVMEGIWAAAPYLHNGSVPTLAELLKQPSARVSSFQVGPAYDKVNVGLAANQPKFGYKLTTGCGDRNSGDSNCGHDYGTQLKPEEKKALLEYLKTL